MHQHQQRKRIIQIHLYVLAVIANLAALTTLLHGVFVGRFSEPYRAYAIGLTAISVFAWALYLSRAARIRTSKDLDSDTHFAGLMVRR